MPMSTKHTSYGVVPIRINTEGNKEYLLLQNHGGYWGFPKGKPEEGETPKDTALREIFEETGIVVKESQLANSIQYCYEQSIDDLNQTKCIVLYPVYMDVKNISIQDKEIAASCWVTYEGAIALINLPSIVKPLQQVESMNIKI